MSKIPLVGPAFHAVFTIAAGPFNLTKSLITGERIDHALLDHLKSDLGAIQEIAPYVQTVLSVLPVVGTGISGAIGCSLALAEGKPIDKALIAGFEDAMPGGPAGKAIFHVTVAAVSGDNIIAASGEAAIAALHLPPTAAVALKSGLNLAYKAAKGENIPKAALEEARKALPSQELKVAFDTAVAVGHGKKLQDAVVQGVKDIAPSQLGAIAGAGRDVLAKSPVLREIGQKLSDAENKGYQTGLGLLNHAGVNTQTITELRKKLSKAEQTGFDLAASTHIASVLAKPPPKAASNTVAAGYFAGMGMQGATTPQKTAMLTPLVKHPELKRGVIAATVQVRINKSWWWRFKEYFGFV